MSNRSYRYKIKVCQNEPCRIPCHTGLEKGDSKTWTDTYTKDLLESVKMFYIARGCTVETTRVRVKQ